jgi:hypothetical protein
MKKDYKIILTESSWDQIIDRMLVSNDPILVLTAKTIIKQIQTQKNLESIFTINHE